MGELCGVEVGVMALLLIVDPRHGKVGLVISHNPLIIWGILKASASVAPLGSNNSLKLQVSNLGNGG